MLDLRPLLNFSSLTTATAAVSGFAAALLPVAAAQAPVSLPGGVAAPPQALKGLNAAWEVHRVAAQVAASDGGGAVADAAGPAAVVVSGAGGCGADAAGSAVAVVAGAGGAGAGSAEAVVGVGTGSVAVAVVGKGAKAAPPPTPCIQME